MSLQNMLRHALAEHARLDKVIREFFGYVENWRFAPIDDRTNMHWMVIREKLAFRGNPFTIDNIDMGSSSSALIVGRILRGSGFAMVEVDTQSDGNRFLFVLDEALECKDAALCEHYEEMW